MVLRFEVRILVVQQNKNNMGKTTGYKGMLRDRCPKVVDYALKWQKAKERWIDHAYINFIRFYTNNEDKKHATRIILGIAKFYRNFEFDKSIDWDNLTNEEEVYWRRVSSWVRWFMKEYMWIEETYNTYKQRGWDEFDIKVKLISIHLSALLPSNNDSDEVKQAQYEYVDRLVSYLINCFEGRI